jgi:hypothetical protein
MHLPAATVCVECRKRWSLEAFICVAAILRDGPRFQSNTPASTVEAHQIACRETSAAGTQGTTIANPHLMRITTSTLTLVFIACFAIGSVAEAQQNIPPVPTPLRQQRPQTPQRATVVAARDDMRFAVGAGVGGTFTRSAFLDNGFGVDVTVEDHLVPRVSIRGQIGAAWWDIVGLSYAGTIQPLYFTANLVVNVPVGQWRPYVTAGGGAYRFAFSEGDVDGTRTTGGFDIGGGVERFFSRRSAITAEGLYHKVDLVPTSRAVLGFRGAFWVASVGIKQYF